MPVFSNKFVCVEKILRKRRFPCEYRQMLEVIRRERIMKVFFRFLNNFVRYRWRFLVKYCLGRFFWHGRHVFGCFFNNSEQSEWIWNWEWFKGFQKPYFPLNLQPDENVWKLVAPTIRILRLKWFSRLLLVWWLHWSSPTDEILWFLRRMLSIIDLESNGPLFLDSCVLALKRHAWQRETRRGGCGSLKNGL